MVGTKSGDQLGGFELLEEIGRGGMGVVFRARELSLNRDVALKVLLPRLSSETDYIERFKREARVVAALRHPNIVNILAYGESNGQHYFAMDYISGRDLSQVLQERTALPVDEALSITKQIAEALDEAQAHGVTHRDIKPSNIMIDKSGRALIMDFGIARLVDQGELTRTGMILSTPAYAAPEQVAGGVVDVRSDIYSLGAVLFKTLSGRPPVSGATATAVVIKTATEGASPLAEANSALPVPLCDLVDSMLSSDPAERPQTPKDLLAAIDECESALASGSGGALDRTVALGAAARASKAMLRALLPAVGLAALVVVLLLNRPWFTDDPEVTGDLDALAQQSQADAAAALERPVTGTKVSAQLASSLPSVSAGTRQSSDDLQNPFAPDRAGTGIGAVGGFDIVALRSSRRYAMEDPAPPVVPRQPAVLVVVFGDEPVLSLVRAEVAARLLNDDLAVISVHEIPMLRDGDRIGTVPWTPVEVRRYVPADTAQVVVLAHIQKTGSSPLHYFGRVQELTHASFSLQTIDTATGQLIHSASAGAIQYTALNMSENLKIAVTPVASGVGDKIKQYWEKKRRDSLDRG